MAYRGSMMFALGALLLPVTSLTAAESYAKGMAVAREMNTRDGHRYLLTVTPPADRGVDPRVFDAIEIVSGGEAEQAAGSARKAEKTASQTGDDEAVDVSDLHLKLESLSAASCTIRQSGLKFKKVSLNGHRLITLQIFGASAAMVVVYPTKGDVDAGVLNSDGSACHTSLRNAGELDVAACNNCGLSGGSPLLAVIENPLSSQASYVGGFIWVEVN
jgi:hypothetical protein